MCPSDTDFPKVLRFFSPPPPHQDEWYEKVWHVDWVVNHLATIVEIITFLSPVLLPLLVGRISWLYMIHPLFESILDPVLPDNLKPGKTDNKVELEPTPEVTTALSDPSQVATIDKVHNGGAKDADQSQTLLKRSQSLNSSVKNTDSKLIYVGGGKYVESP